MNSLLVIWTVCALAKKLEFGGGSIAMLSGIVSLILVFLESLPEAVRYGSQGQREIVTCHTSSTASRGRLIAINIQPSTVRANVWSYASDGIAELLAHILSHLLHLVKWVIALTASSMLPRRAGPIFIAPYTAPHQALSTPAADKWQSFHHRKFP